MEILLLVFVPIVLARVVSGSVFLRAFDKARRSEALQASCSWACLAAPILAVAFTFFNLILLESLFLISNVRCFQPHSQGVFQQTFSILCWHFTLLGMWRFVFYLIGPQFGI